jgi:hypothetical protein
MARDLPWLRLLSRGSLVRSQHGSLGIPRSYGLLEG